MPCSDRCKCAECKNSPDLYALVKVDVAAAALAAPVISTALASHMPSLSATHTSKYLPGTSSASSASSSASSSSSGGGRRHSLSRSGSEDETYGRPYTYNVSGSALSAASAGGGIGLRSPALVAGSRSGTRANSLLASMSRQPRDPGDGGFGAASPPSAFADAFADADAERGAGLEPEVSGGPAGTDAGAGLGLGLGGFAPSSVSKVESAKSSHASQVRRLAPDPGPYAAPDRSSCMYLARI